MSDFEFDVFEPAISFVLDESKADGDHVLSKMKGSFFMPNGKSRNGRFYPKELWENVLSNPEIQQKLKEKRMFGTVGHGVELTDEAIGEGKASHIVTDLKLNKDGVSGYGEAVILNTPCGRNLNTMLRAGSKLFVSSRAKGKFNGTQEGVQKVDPKSYLFKTFDFVTEPGFLEAAPNLVENLETKTDKGDTGMTADGKLLENLSRENVELRDQVKELLESIKELKGDKKSIESKAVKLEETLGKESDKSDVIAEYKVIGSPKEIMEAMDKSTALVEKYKVFGTPEEIDETYDEVEETITKYKALGTTSDIEEALDKAKELHEKFTDLGSSEEITEALDKATDLHEEYKELGTVKEIGQVFDKSEELCKQYAEIGTPEEISEVYDRVEALVEHRNQEKQEVEINKLAEELSVPVASVAKVYESMEADEIRELFKSIKGTAVIQEKYTKKEEVVSDKDDDDDDINPMSENLTTRLIRGFGK